MALEPDPHLKDIIDTLLNRFAPVYSEWLKSQPNADAALPKTADECLYKDLYALGNTVACLDHKQGKRLEMNLLAEVLALLRKNPQNMPYEYIVETVDKEISSANAANAEFVPKGEVKVPDALMIKVINEWADGRPMREESAKAAVESLMALMRVFVLRDGTISNQEMAFFTVLEKRFTLKK